MQVFLRAPNKGVDWQASEEVDELVDLGVCVCVCVCVCSGGEGEVVGHFAALEFLFESV